MRKRFFLMFGIHLSWTARIKIPSCRFRPFEPFKYFDVFHVISEIFQLPVALWILFKPTWEVFIASGWVRVRVEDIFRLNIVAHIVIADDRRVSYSPFRCLHLRLHSGRQRRSIRRRRKESDSLPERIPLLLRKGELFKTALLCSGRHIQTSN